jgi:sortase A
VTIAPAAPSPDEVKPAPQAPTSDGQPGKTWDRQRIAGVVALSVAGVLVGFLLFVAYFSALPQQRAQAALQTRFDTAVGDAEAPLGGIIAAGYPVARIDIPSIGVHQIVVEGTTADRLKSGPGHLPTSPLPGQIGNSVIVGHSIAYGGPFHDISSLKSGAKITVLTQQGKFTYTVKDRSRVNATDTKVFAAAADNRLTLVTSGDLFDSTRTVVVAKLVGKPAPAPGGRPATLLGVEEGLAGGGGAGPAILGWLEVALLAGVVAFFAYRRLPRASAWIITTPIILVALWLFYSAIARVLPATF